MVTMVSLGVVTVTPVGSDDPLIVSAKFSFISNIWSSFIEMLSGALVSPAGNMTVYGPES